MSESNRPVAVIVSPVASPKSTSPVATKVVKVPAAGVLPPTTPSDVPTNAVDVIDVAPVTTPRLY